MAAPGPAGRTADRFFLSSGQKLMLELAFDPAAMFHDDGQVLVAPFADADENGDADDAITLSELAADSSLFEGLYFTHLPRLVELPTGSCAARVNPTEDD